MTSIGKYRTVFKVVSWMVATVYSIQYTTKVKVLDAYKMDLQKSDSK